MTTTYIQIHGARLRWVKSTLQQAGVAVHDVQRGPDGLYYLAVNVADSARAATALLPIENYVRGKQPTRRPLDLRIMDAMLLAGVAVAGAVALVTPQGGALVLLMMGVYRLIGGRLHEHAATMHQAGGRYRLYAVVGMAVALLVMAAFIGCAAWLAGAQIAAGNSALKLLKG